MPDVPLIMPPADRLREIAAIIEQVDVRCAASDGPVVPTIVEIRQAEIGRIYALASAPVPSGVDPDAPRPTPDDRSITGDKLLEVLGWAQQVERAKERGAAEYLMAAGRLNAALQACGGIPAVLIRLAQIAGFERARDSCPATRGAA